MFCYLCLMTWEWLWNLVWFHLANLKNQAIPGIHSQTSAFLKDLWEKTDIEVSFFKKEQINATFFLGLKKKFALKIEKQ